MKTNYHFSLTNKISKAKISKALCKGLVLGVISCLASFAVNADPNTNTKGTNSKAELQPADAKQQSKADDQTLYLFTHSAREATIKENAQQPGTYTITLKQVTPYITYFSERPIREAGTLEMAKFLKIWESSHKNSFKENAPNANFHAYIVGEDKKDQRENYVLVLTEPKYQAETKTLTYQAKLVPGSSPLPKSATFNDVTIFIDGFCLSCW